MGHVDPTHTARGTGVVCPTGTGIPSHSHPEMRNKNNTVYTVTSQGSSDPLEESKCATSGGVGG